MQNQHVSSLLDREVTRQEFLAISGLAAASVFGLGTIIKLLTGKSLGDHRLVQNQGYGRSLYGK